MSNNSWYEKGELPPVGSNVIVESGECTDQYVQSFNGMQVYIVLHMVDHTGDPIAVFSMIEPKEMDCLKFHGMMQHCFKPIRSKRDIAVEEMAILINSAPFNIALTVAEKLYDAGYRKTNTQIN